MENEMYIVTVKSYLVANFNSERQGNGELRLGFHPSVITTALDTFQRGDFWRTKAIE